MNLTITQNRINKQPPNTAIGQLPVQLSPIGPVRTNDSKRKQCDSFFFVSCLNAHPTEPSERSEENELIFHRLPPSKLQAQPKRKISLSINPNNTSFHTPRLNGENKEPTSEKQTLLASPITLKQRSGEASRIKITLNSVTPSEIKPVPEASESKQMMTRNSMEPSQYQAQSRPTQSRRPSFAEKIEHSASAAKVQHCSEKKIVQFVLQDRIIDADENYSFLEKSEHSCKQIQQGINWKERLKNRRCIGEYARTIKTLQASEQRENLSEIQSIVIGRGLQTDEGRMMTPLSRGSTKECPVEEETLRRGYGSVGDELHKAHLVSRFSREVDQAIEEDLYDYEP